MSTGTVRAEQAHLDAIEAIEAAGFPEGQRWTRAAWQAELTAPRRLVLVRTLSGAVLGVATFALAGDVADLLRVVVAPQSRRQGVAADLLSAGRSWAREGGAARMLLEVRPDNTEALALYSGLGFTELSRRRDYYAPGVDALVMEAAL